MFGRQLKGEFWNIILLLESSKEYKSEARREENQDLRDQAL